MEPSTAAQWLEFDASGGDLSSLSAVEVYDLLAAAKVVAARHGGDYAVSLVERLVKGKLFKPAPDRVDLEIQRAMDRLRSKRLTRDKGKP